MPTIFTRLISGRILGVIVTLIILSFVITAMAKPVTRSQARSAVCGWLATDMSLFGLAPGTTVRELRMCRTTRNRATYYVASLDPSGFVVLSGDDLIEPVIAFSDVGEFDFAGSVPLVAMLNSDVSDRTNKARALDLALRKSRSLMSLTETSTRTRTMWRSLISAGTATHRLASMASVSDPRVDPFLETAWGQTTAGGNATFNYYSPPGVAGVASNYPVGCGATTMAQVMRYFAYPATGAGTPSFEIKVDGGKQTRSLRGGDGLGGPYQWDLMVASPDGFTSVASRQAIGALCYDAGLSIKTEYTADSSSSVPTNIANALTGTYGYSNAMSAFNAGTGIGAGLTTIINPNLDAKRPVMLAIDGVKGAHGVLTDGYGYQSGTLYHHLNMGWSGSDNAWYNLPDIDASLNAFTTVYACVYNIFPTGGTGEIISGRVLDTGGTPISGATVTAAKSGDDGAYTATTDIRGIFAFSHVPSASIYLLTASKTGYSFAGTTANVGTSTTDAATSGNVWGLTLTGTGDFIPPTATISLASGQTSPTALSPIRFTVAFSESVTGFTAGDVVLGGTANPSSVTIDGTGPTYTVSVGGMTGSGTVTALVRANAVVDAVGNDNAASSAATVAYDITAPTVTVEQSPLQDDPTTSISFSFAVTFSEPVSGFASGRIAISGTAGASSASVSGAGPAYTVLVNSALRSGTVTLSVPEGGVHDSAGNGNLASTSTDHSVYYEGPPAVTVERAAGQHDATNVSPINFTVTFTEDVQDFVDGDVTISGSAGGTTAAVTGTGKIYNVTVSGMSTDGTVVVTVAAGKAHDASARPNTASTSVDNSVIYDLTAPTVSFTKPAATGPVDRIGSSLRIEGTASDISGISGSTWALGGATGNCTGTTTWSADGLALVSGTNTVTVTTTDLAGNTGTASLIAECRDDSPGISWNGLMMVGVPAVPDVTDSLDVVGFARGYWQAYLPFSSTYAKYAASENASWLSPVENTPGRGFWAYFDAAAPAPSGNVPAQDVPATIHLKAGWNLISNPFLKSVTWDVDLVKAKVGASDAASVRDSSGVVAEYLWGWTQDSTDKGTGVYHLVADPSVIPAAGNVIEPWMGYWIKATVDCDLIIPAP